MTVRRKGVQGVVIISASLTKIRLFARENGVHVWLVAHPAKLRKEKNERGDMVYLPMQ